MEEHAPYARQLLLKEIGEAGQQKLEAAKVFVIGAGGLGAPVLQYLAAAGVGTIGICDCDKVDITNLNRQVLHRYRDIDVYKVDSAAEKLKHMRPDLALKLFYEPITPANTAPVKKGWDLVLDCTDNFVARHVISDVCREQGIPHIESGIHGWEGFVFPIWDNTGPCYRCLYPEEPTDVDKPIPVLGATCGIIGSIMALEAITWIAGVPKTPGTLFKIEGLQGQVRKIKWPKAEHCQCTSL